MKKLFASLTVSTLILAIQNIPASAQVGPGNQSNQPFICTRDYNGRLNMRSGPGRQFGIITQLANGMYVQQLSSRQGSDGFLWYQINYRGAVGWVRGDYLCK